MNDKAFMLDIETTGIFPETEDLLQVAALEVVYDGRFWQPGRFTEILMPSSREPQSEFAKKHMAELYRKANELHRAGARFDPIMYRKDLLSFFESCGVTGQKVVIMGKNASNFDLPFLNHHKVLEAPGKKTGPDGKDYEVGDYSYRIDDMTGRIYHAMDVTGIRDRRALENAAVSIYSGVELPKDRKAHDGLYDCYHQLKMTNGLILLTRGLGKV